MSTPQWLSMLPDFLRLSEVSNRLESIRVRFGVSQEDFARSVFRTPSAIRWFIISSNSLMRRNHEDTHERFGLILVLLEKYLHKSDTSQEEHFEQIAEATLKAHGIGSQLQLIDIVLRDEKKRGTFYNPNHVLREIEPLVYLSGQGTIGWCDDFSGLDLVDSHRRLFDYEEEPDNCDPLYALPKGRLTESPQLPTSEKTMSWSPDPRILQHIKTEHPHYLEALKSCPDRVTLERVASLLYYSAETSFKLSNLWYTPPRFQMGTQAEMMNHLLFQQAGAAAMEGFMELSGDLMCYHFNRELNSLRVLQTKSSQSLERCGLREVPGVVDWIQNET
jgi:hypothetical protein